MLKYAFAHPGKMGDFLYILPTVKYICERDGAIADIYTSEMCRPTESLIKYQSYVNDFIIPPEYKMEHFNLGVQPWNIPIDESQYDKVYQLGFQAYPDGPLHKYIAKCIGIEDVADPQYEYPDITFYDKPYVVVGYCSHHTDSRLEQAYEYFVETCPIQTVQVGGSKDRIKSGKPHDQIGIDFLNLASLISNASAYVGFYSGQTAIANGFQGLLKILTSSRSGGEDHGLYIPKTINLPNTCNGSDILLTLLENKKE